MTQYLNITNSIQLVLPREIRVINIYCDNHTKHMSTGFLSSGILRCVVGNLTYPDVSEERITFVIVIVLFHKLTRY
jgi:hypothetical protein